jgi:hypothetical protein
MACSVQRTRLTFAYVELCTCNDLDRRRQRVAVHIQPEGGGESLFLGDVWRSRSTGRWHFTIGPGNLRRGDTSSGFRTREEAAWALLNSRIAEAEAHLREVLDDVNSLRRAAGEDPVAVA